jgi:hypothetical protein
MARNTWEERETGRTECKDHDHVACHAGAILPAAKTDILYVERDGYVEDDCSNADGRVGRHVAWCWRTL